MSNTLPIALTRLLEKISTINSVDPHDHYAACWVSLRLHYGYQYLVCEGYAFSIISLPFIPVS